jgi:hypothetical protein
MKSANELIGLTSRELLALYIDELENNYYRWYYKQMRANGNRWRRWSYVSLFSSILAAGCATLQTSNIKFVVENKEFLTIALIVIPLFGTLASSILMHEKLYEIYQLRENGRENIQYLVSEGKRRLATVVLEKDASDIHKYLIEEVRKVEIAQSQQYFSTNNKQ